jgi:hypothetical protein
MVKIKNRHIIRVFLCLLFLDVSFNCKKKTKIMRNFDIDIIALNSDAYNNTYKPLIANLNAGSLNKVVQLMENNPNDGGGQKKMSNIKIHFDDVFESTTSPELEEKIFQSVAEKYKNSPNNETFREKIDIDILQPVLFFTSSEYFREKFQSDLFYHPPLVISGIFKPFYNELNIKVSDKIEFINPFTPFLENIETDGQIYHVILKKAMVSQIKGLFDDIQDRTLKEHPEIKNDFIFLNDMFQKALSNEVIIVMRLMS